MKAFGDHSKSEKINFSQKDNDNNKWNNYEVIYKFNSFKSYIIKNYNLNILIHRSKEH